MATTLGFTTPSLIAATTGIVGSAWTSGAIASISLIGIPAYLSSPDTSAQIWATSYERGKNTMPKVAIAVALAYFYAAYDSHGRDAAGAWKGFLGAAGLVLVILPFTRAVMKPTNDSLHSIASGSSATPQIQSGGLLKKWSALNIIRSLFPLAGAALGFVTLLANATA
ncbi:protein of unknown function (DUF1772) [Geosmithia morbida]|uniref:Uncharacterized protein n=1 Tax=Geosmithia morbida TaxID=1094350 RepID=A0A9P4YTW9_9HYPO|nr:protein of unknown function (DUF1772) [Geosmithia morbida]KAF4121732.1 protein of unknown function (DUF1772) [Geosmithia morbida]